MRDARAGRHRPAPAEHLRGDLSHLQLAAGHRRPHGPVQEAKSGSTVAAALLAELRKEPPGPERQAGFSTDVPESLRVSGPRAGDPKGALRLSEQPEDLTAEALAQIVCTYTESEPLVQDGTVMLGGPGKYAPRGYLCTAETKASPKAVPTLGAVRLS